MAQYINKTALVAEIDSWRDGIKKGIFSIPLTGSDRAYATFEYEILGKVKDLFDTLEVKEVDLEKEIDKWWCSQFTDYSMKRVPNHKFIPAPAYIDSNFKQSVTGKTKIAFELCMDWKVDSNDIEWDSETIREFAKHFFELGLKVQK